MSLLYYGEVMLKPRLTFLWTTFVLFFQGRKNKAYTIIQLEMQEKDRRARRSSVKVPNLSLYPTFYLIFYLPIYFFYLLAFLLFYFLSIHLNKKMTEGKDDLV